MIKGEKKVVQTAQKSKMRTHPPQLITGLGFGPIKKLKSFVVMMEETTRISPEIWLDIAILCFKNS